MKQKSILIVLIALCIVAGGTTFILQSKKDVVAPVITFQKGSIYYDGSDTKTLLANVKAHDDRDGNVTKSLIVSDIYKTSDTTGIVVYSAKDHANNIATASRGFFYKGANTKEAVGLESDTQTQAESETETQSESGEMTQTQYDQLEKDNLAKKTPFVQLTQHKLTIHVGDKFSIYPYLKTVKDDKDKSSTMLRVEGKVDTAKAGVYNLSVYARDKDGNTSNIEKLAVTVQ